MRSAALRGAFLIGVLAALPADSRAQTREPVAAFVDVSVIPMDREQILPNYTVLVKGRRIVAMGKAETVPVPRDAVTIDGRGKFLLPGLADMHMHFNREDPPVEPLLALYVANGVTTLRSLDGVPGFHPELRDRVAKGELVGPRIYTAGEYVNELTTLEEAKAVVAEQKEAGYDFIKIHDDNGGIDPAVFDSFVAIARRAGLPVVGHTPPRVGLAGMLRAHVASIEHLSNYFAYVHGFKTRPSQDSAIALPVADDAKILEIANLTKQAGVWNCPTMLTGKTGSVDRDLGPERNIFATLRKVVKALHDVGAGLLLGTDGGTGGAIMSYAPPELKIFPASEIPAELALLVQAGLTPYQAIETGTRNPAVFLGTLDSTGTIAVGKRADLVLLSGNPLTDVGQLKKPVGTMLGGQWYPRDELIARVAADKDFPAEYYR